MVRRLRIALLIIAVGATIYLIFPTIQTQLQTPAADTHPCSSPGDTGIDALLPACYNHAAALASLQHEAWYEFARVEVIVVVIAAAVWVLVPSIASGLQSRERP